MTAKYSIIVWDWNGTLLDDVAINLHIVNTLLHTRGIPPISSERYKQVFRMPIRDFYHDIGFDMTKEPFEVIAREYNRLYTAHFDTISLTEGVHDVLCHARDKGIDQYILSASEKTSLAYQVNQKGISPFFQAIVGNDDFSVIGKIDKARLLAKELGDTKNILFIGDLHHDAEVASAMGADCVLYANGHQTTRKDPRYHLIYHMSEILNLL